MASMTIAEYKTYAGHGDNVLPILQEPPLRAQTAVGLSATSAISAAFGTDCNFAKVGLDVAAHLRVSDTGNVAATVDDPLYPIGVHVFPVRAGWKIAGRT